MPDLNGPLYIVDKDMKKLTVYLDFNGREGKPGIFQKLFLEAGYGIQFNTPIHQLGDLIFNPAVRPGDVRMAHLVRFIGRRRLRRSQSEHRPEWSELRTA